MALSCTPGSIRGARDWRVRTAIAALTSFALLVIRATDAEAYAVKRTSRGELVHWEGRSVEYTIDPSIELNVAGATDAALTAMDSWSGTVGAPELIIAERDREGPTRPGFDEKNGVFFAKGGYGPAGRALAITVLTYDNTSGRILDADIIFNGAYTFEVLDAPGRAVERETTTHVANTDRIVHEEERAVARAKATVYDLHHVIAHELGHSLGMNDEMGLRDALMYRYSSPNDATIRHPNADDIAGLAELYSTKLEARGNGCGNATIAPKKPADTASRTAMVAALGLVLFLALRARSDRRARVGFVLATAAAMVAFLPSLAGKESGTGMARADESQQGRGHARAKVLAASTSIESGLFKTTYALETTECRASGCPIASHGWTWGGTMGGLTQEVGDQHAPVPGEEVDVSFKVTPNALASIVRPLAGRAQETIAEVRVLTRAR